MVVEYFRLQVLMFHRSMRELGIRPLLAWPLLSLIFVLLSVFLFQKTAYAGYIYVIVSIGLTTKRSDVKRNEFLKTCFQDSIYRKIRILENLILSLPFVLFLFVKEHFSSGLILLLLTLVLAFVNFRPVIHFRLPTPFFRKPFEFMIGFRNTVVLILGAYGLAIIAVTVDNFNLGLFAIMLIFGLAITFYPKPENEFYIWVFALSPGKFLFEKLKTAFFQVTLLVIPLLVILVPVYYSQSLNLLFVVLMGYAFLGYIILAKYAAWPREMGIITAVLIAFCLYFPPLLVGVIPYFYVQSRKHLSQILK